MVLHNIRARELGLAAYKNKSKKLVQIVLTAVLLELIIDFVFQEKVWKKFLVC